MAPIIGFLHRSICATGSDSISLTSPLNTSSAAVRSTPEQNDRPDPDKIITRTEGSLSKDLNAWAISVIIDLVNEFNDFGRLIVIYPIPFGSRVTRIRPSGLGSPIGEGSFIFEFSHFRDIILFASQKV
ncbi:hypothetical protein Pint_24331 [Pistacia integerrima]|uniref:Uncharacterized protein n=1 Tax=Pistacia integerrima TaxID=434235 RepID=A0ACC0YG78_9ROSI|nr:hypothetical protein Pint_24331 [Pistacia integerrima]